MLQRLAIPDPDSLAILTRATAAMAATIRDYLDGADFEPLQFLVHFSPMLHPHELTQILEELVEAIESDRVYGISWAHEMVSHRALAEYWYWFNQTYSHESPGEIGGAGFHVAGINYWGFLKGLWLDRQSLAELHGINIEAANLEQRDIVDGLRLDPFPPVEMTEDDRPDPCWARYREGEIFPYVEAEVSAENGRYIARHVSLLRKYSSVYRFHANRRGAM